MNMIVPNVAIDAEKIQLLDQVQRLAAVADALVLLLVSDMRANSRWARIGATQIQLGCMALERAIVRLDKDRL